jgi:hypothetical protein
VSLSLFGAKNGAKNKTCSIFSTKIAFFHPKRLKIWRCFEKCVPLHCQKETMEFERRAPKIISQAWKNLLPAQSANNSSGNRQTVLIDHKLI